MGGALHVRALAEFYGVPVILHTDHCSKALLPWFDGLLEAGRRALHWSPARLALQWSSAFSTQLNFSAVVLLYPSST